MYCFPSVRKDFGKGQNGRKQHEKKTGLSAFVPCNGAFDGSDELLAKNRLRSNRRYQGRGIRNCIDTFDVGGLRGKGFCR